MSVYMQAYITPFLVVMYLLHDSGRMLPRTPQNSVYKMLLGCVSVVMLMDALAWELNGNAALGVLLWVINGVYILVAALCGPLWFMFVAALLGSNGRPRARMAMCASLVGMALLFLLIVSSPWTKWMYEVDVAGVYHRGPLLILQQLYLLVFLMLSLALALHRLGRETQIDKRRQYQTLAALSVAVIAGGVVQVLMYGVTVLWPTVVVCLLIVFASMQRAQISTDELTGLNNRGRMEHYLADRCERAQTPWYFVLLDIDDFKQINDRYGHPSGDAALREMAAVLKKSFHQEDAFLARYGGDEFAIVLSGRTDDEIEARLATLEAACAATDSRHPWRLRLSAGYARYDEGMLTLSQLIAQADQCMYQAKQCKKSAKLSKK